MFNVLIAEDDRHARKLMEAVLKREGYNVFAVENGIEALDMLDAQQIDVIILDVMMPQMDGYALTKELREAGVTIPILMATAKQLPRDKKEGFLSGADDYMTKPIDTEEMLWRIGALLRRAKITNERRLTIGGVVLDYDSLSVTRGKERQTLPQKEFYLLYKLLANPERIFTRLQLMDEIWGMESESVDNTVTVHINRLRKRFENYDEFQIVSVRGLGYKAVRSDA